MQVDLTGYLIWPLFILSALLTGYAINLLHKYVVLLQSKKRTVETKKTVSYSLALAVILLIFSFLSATGIYEPTIRSTHVSDITPVYNKDGTLRHNRDGSIKYDTHYSTTSSKGSLADREICAFTLAPGVLCLYPIYSLKKSLKEES